MGTLLYIIFGIMALAFIAKVFDESEDYDHLEDLW